MARHAPPVRVQCNAATVSGASSAPPPPVSTDAHPQQNSQPNGCMFITDRKRLYRPADVEYLWAGVAQFIAFQGLSWPDSGRASETDGYEEIIAVNPFVGLWYHDSNIVSSEGFRSKGNITNGIQYNHIIDNRANSIAYLDAGKKDEVCGKINPESGTGIANFNVNITDSGLQEYMAKIAFDIITGSNTSGRGINGPNLVAHVAYFNDAMQWFQPRGGAKAMKPLGKGTIDTIVETLSNPNQAKVIRVNSQPNPNTSGTIDYNSVTYNAVTSNSYLLFMFPSNINNSGLIGHQVAGYRNIGGGQSEILVENLPNRAALTQPYSPSAGDRWCLSNPSDTSTSIDWDADGTGEPSGTTGHDNWATGYNEFWDNLEAKVNTLSGIKTGRGCNTVTGTHNAKRDNGLAENLVQKDAFDVVNAENGDATSGFSANFISAGHTYNTKSVDLSTLMRQFYFGTTYIRDIVDGGFPKRMRGVAYEIRHWGNSYSDINPLDANYLRFFMCIMLTVPDTFMVSTARQRTAHPIMIEENWIDFDTDRVTVPELGTYNETADNDKGTWTWASADCGERIYVRKITETKGIAINMADPPANYPDDYAPSHLSASAGYTPYAVRDPEDIIPKSVFDAKFGSATTVTHFDPPNYTNPVMTSAAGITWGPRQAHPRDNNGTGTHGQTLSTATWIARDNVLNDGSTVNTSAGFGLGILQSVVFELS